MDNFTQKEAFAKRKYFSFEERKILEKLVIEDINCRKNGEKGISRRSMGEYGKRGGTIYTKQE